MLHADLYCLELLLPFILIVFPVLPLLTQKPQGILSLNKAVHFH